ncbi:MAG: hypothetical protein QOJ64_4274 [Acidobacteriota bacterium]|jgi:hypothetical protein|nr:hypothetical protein [Acidobacteriota bacterium]
MTAACQRGQVKGQAADPIPQDTLITLERWPDFFLVGPFYKVTISADGAVRFEPRAYNNKYREKVVGGNIITGRISQEQLQQLIAEFERINFYSLPDTSDDPRKNSKDDCPNYLYDSSATVLAITTKGKSKEVHHYLGCDGTKALSDLIGLEYKIDEAVNTKQFLDRDRENNNTNASKPPGSK